MNHQSYRCKDIRLHLGLYSTITKTNGQPNVRTFYHSPRVMTSMPLLHFMDHGTEIYPQATRLSTSHSTRRVIPSDNRSIYLPMFLPMHNGRMDSDLSMLTLIHVGDRSLQVTVPTIKVPRLFTSSTCGPTHPVPADRLRFLLLPLPVHRLSPPAIVPLQL